jgi:tryptophan synthase alpha chain
MIAIANGMTIELLFKQLKAVKKDIHVPLILMGYLNPVMQYGLEKFCADAASAGVSALILPDMPMYEYEHIYKKYFTQNNLSLVFLITPQTSEARIKKADALSSGFLYAVSSNSVTGSTLSNEGQNEYFVKLAAMKLKNPLMIGFGINSKETFAKACKYAAGAIVGSAYIKAISKAKNIETATSAFVKTIR